MKRQMMGTTCARFLTLWSPPGDPISDKNRAPMVIFTSMVSQSLADTLFLSIWEQFLTLCGWCDYDKTLGKTWGNV